MTQIIAFEGLHPLLIPWLVPSYVKRGLLDPLIAQAEFDELKNQSMRVPSVWRGGFMSSGPTPIKGAKTIVIGHSMGGPSAMSWCRKNWPHEIELLLTLDPRPLHRPYDVRPDGNVKRAVNIYQQGWWMQGFPVEGAENIYAPGWGHGAIPAHPRAAATIREALA